MTKSYRVLVADDDVDHVTIVRTILEQNGYEAIVALDGEETLAIVENQLPDLVLLDIMMPKVDGLEVVRRLKENPKTRDLPVIMFSAKSGTREIMESFNYGASNYLIKPIDSDRLLEKIQATLRKEQFRENLEKRFKGGAAAEAAERSAEVAAAVPAPRRASLAATVGQFLTAVDPPLETLARELTQLGGPGLPDREVRQVSRKVDAIAALCAELRDMVGDAEDA